MVRIRKLFVLEDVDEPMGNYVGGVNVGGNGAGAGGVVVQNIEEGPGGGDELVGGEDAGGIGGTLYCCATLLGVKTL